MENQDIKLQIAEKIWNVNLHLTYKKSNKFAEGRFSAGWMQFMRDNHLKKGDVCIFEMFKTDISSVFHVRILRKTMLRN